jgi:hypothetical protein
MPALTDLVGLAGAAALVASAFLALPGVPRLRRARPLLLLVVGVVVALAPVAALPAAGYVRGVVGDLSLTTLLLLLRGLLRPVCGWGPVEGRNRLTLQTLVVAGGLALYPLSLGLGDPDPYRWGYASPVFLGVLFLLAMVAWFQGLHLVAASLALAVLAWAVGASESRNLWDYLIDPLVTVWALGALLLRGATALVALRRRLVVKPVRHQYRLRDLLKGIDRRDRHAEVRTGSAVGKEIW